MKLLINCGVGVLAIALVGGLASGAPDGAPRKRPLAADRAGAKRDGAVPTTQQWQDILDRFDKDGDGKLSAEEQAALQEEIKGRREGNRDGKGGKGVGDGQLREKIIEKFDKDGDGKLNDEERAAAQEAMKERREKAGKDGGVDRQKLIEKFDKDGDGKLNDEERAAAKESIKEHRDKPATQPAEKP